MYATQPDSPAIVLASNFEFLLGIFGLEHANNAFVTGFQEDPTAQHDNRTRARMWRGQRWGSLRKPLPREWNNYYCISTFKASTDPQDNGQPRRKKALHEATFVIVFDDVGQKVPWDKVLLAPTYILLTSPGNCQVGYRLTVPERDAPKVERLIDGLIVTGLASDNKDPGMRGVTRFIRLPYGTNRKSKYGAMGIACELREWNPQRTYTVEQIAEAHGISLAPPVKDGPATSSIQLSDVNKKKIADDILNALEQEGAIIGEDANAPGKWHIRCPWIDTHSDRDDSGTAYFEPGYTDRTTGTVAEKGGFKCWHGHCEDKHMRDLVSWLRERGHNAVVHPDTAFEFQTLVEEQRRIDPEIFNQLQRSEETGDILGGWLNNLELLLFNDRVLNRCVRFNTFTHTHEIMLEGCTTLDSVAAWIITECERVYNTHFKHSDVMLMLGRLLDRNRVDPLQMWGTTMAEQWDGTARVNRMFVEHAGATEQPAEYVESVSRAFMLGAAHRALVPGFKFDNMIILEGMQGIYKSTLCKVISPVAEWAGAGILDVQHKDSVADMLGKFIYEIEELQTFRRSKDVDALKAFLSRTHDRTRLSYRRDSADYPRRTVFIGTTNRSKYLEDEDDQAQRRFWPIKLLGFIDIAWFQANRDQLWAEALHHAQKGELPVLPEPLRSVVEAQQLLRAHTAEDHPWYQALVRIWRDPECRYAWPKQTTSGEILSMLGVAVDRQTRANEMVASRVLKALGYEHMRVKSAGKRQWAWIRKETEGDELLQ